MFMAFSIFSGTENYLRQVRADEFSLRFLNSETYVYFLLFVHLLLIAICCILTSACVSSSPTTDWVLLGSTYCR